MINLQEFAIKLHQQVVSIYGEELLQRATANPPKPNTSEFSKVVDVLLAFIGRGKTVKQDSAITFMTANPQFATTMVMQAIRSAMFKRDHALKLVQLEEFVEILAEHCANLILGEPAEDGKMKPEQVGAAHNLLNLAEIVYEEQDKQYHTVGHFRDLVTFRFDEGKVDKKFLERTNWVEGYSPRRDARNISSGRVSSNRHPSNGARSANSQPLAPSSTQAPVQEAPASVFAGKLNDALKSPAPTATVVVEESPEEQARLMSAAADHLTGLNPEAIDRAKRGEGSHVAQLTSATRFEVEPAPETNFGLPQVANGLDHTQPLHEEAVAGTIQ